MPFWHSSVLMTVTICLIDNDSQALLQVFIWQMYYYYYPMKAWYLFFHIRRDKQWKFHYYIQCDIWWWCVLCWKNCTVSSPMLCVGGFSWCVMVSVGSLGAVFSSLFNPGLLGISSSARQRQAPRLQFPTFPSQCVCMLVTFLIPSWVRATCLLLSSPTSVQTGRANLSLPAFLPT